MPTVHVAPGSQEALQGIADSLFKARKVVVVTGAGISTNSGIPDFRSENGLYSLIQAQFDAAAQARQVEQAVQPPCEPVGDDFEEGRARKRRRISRESTIEVTTEATIEVLAEIIVDGPAEVEDIKDEIQVDGPDVAEDQIEVGGKVEVKEQIRVGAMEDIKDQIRVGDDDGDIKDEILVGMKDEIEVQGYGTMDARDEDTADCIVAQPEHEDTEPSEADAAENVPVVLRRSARHSITVAQPMTSPLSSPPPEESMNPPSACRKTPRSRLADVQVHPSSSPLSSPPPTLFDPFASSSPSDRHSSRSSTSPSEVDDSESSPPSSNPFSASQTSNSGRTLPNMKGKDLFDASIWADPLRTSVFYTFATSLRQKIKEVQPTSSHRFISHLRDRGKLVRCYTQNIDQIEEKVGLSTSLQDGPGSRGRFSRKSTANMSQLVKMVEESTADSNADCGSSNQPQQGGDALSQRAESSQADGISTPMSTEGDTQTSDNPKTLMKHPRRGLPRSGVECVFLHGSLEQLRCFLCGRVCSWDDDCREQETLSGQQPECPHCVGATTAREERGKRALGVGKLRPDIVLYGEEHPNAHLISPIVTHDLALCPDMLLILGTSLRVHGLKVMVREFAKAVHAKGGKVVFVNFTKPPESSWGDVIDYWIEWDCDAWVSDLQDKIPKLWQAPELPKPRKKRESAAASDDNEKEKRPPPANPVALRDTKATAAYWTSKVINELHSITGHQPLKRRASMSTTTSESAMDRGSPLAKANKPRAKRPRNSAPGALERPKRNRSTLNPNHGRLRRGINAASHIISPAALKCVKKEIRAHLEADSIINSVKKNPRIRKKKMIDGEEVVMPSVGKRQPAAKKAPPKYTPTSAELKLPPLCPQPLSPTLFGYSRPEPLEPKSPPHGPLATISPNMRSAALYGRETVFYYHDAMQGLRQPPLSFPQMQREHQRPSAMDRPPSRDETAAIMGLVGLKGEPGPLDRMTSSSESSAREALRGWGQRWHQKL